MSLKPTIDVTQRLLRLTLQGEPAPCPGGEVCAAAYHALARDLLTVAEKHRGLSCTHPISLVIMVVVVDLYDTGGEEFTKATEAVVALKVQGVLSGEDS